MDSSSEIHSPKRIRKGTKSCVECRQRKIKCIFSAETDQTCTGCATRQRPCVPQVYQRKSSHANSFRRDRIGRLEKQLASIAAAVQEKGGHVGSVASPSVEPSVNLSATTEEDAHIDNHPMEGPATTAPTHLKFLFDNSLIAPSGQRGEIEQVSHPPCSQKYLDQARAKLQNIMPAKSDVRAAASYGTAWMMLHQSLFTSVLQFGTTQAMIDKYDDQLSSDARPVEIASFLLAFAITVRQVPSDEQRLTIQDVAKYVQDVLHVVEATIVSHTGVASTVEGLSTTVLYMRLQLGLGQIKPLWLTLRRTIAIAELIGLPRAWNSNHFESTNRHRTDGRQSVYDPRINEKVTLWEAICATDRLASMMFNLPAATGSFSFPKRQIVSPVGEVMSQPYLLELAGVAMRVQELDESYTFGKPLSEVYETVLTIDKDIRSLKSLTPRQWWVDDSADFSGDHLVQFWHYYLLVRTHVHSAMSTDEHDQYSYSRKICIEACQSLAQRYGYVRRHLPPGFFVCRIIDMQIFTAAMFLVLSCYGQTVAQNSHGFSPQSYQDEQQLASVQYILKTMDAVSGQVGSEFAVEASSAIRSLLALFGNPVVANSQGLTLRIPLLGKIHIAAKQQIPPPQQMDFIQPNPGLFDHTTTTASNTTNAPMPADNMNAFPTPPDALPWFMELDMNSSSLQDPFILNEIGDWNQWMEDGSINFAT